MVSATSVLRNQQVGHRVLPQDARKRLGNLGVPVVLAARMIEKCGAEQAVPAVKWTREAVQNLLRGPIAITENWEDLEACIKSCSLPDVLQGLLDKKGGVEVDDAKDVFATLRKKTKGTTPVLSRAEAPVFLQLLVDGLLKSGLNQSRMRMVLVCMGLPVGELPHVDLQFTLFFRGVGVYCASIE